MPELMRSTLEKTARFGRDPFALLIAVLAGLGTAHILVRTAPYGAAVTYDSSYLLSTVINFLAGAGWQDLAGGPMVTWPPLFPLLLAASGWVGIEPLEAGRLLNATTFGLTILAAGLWLHSHLRSRWLVLVATATLTTSLPLSYRSSYLLTEPLFVLLTLLALMQLAAFLQRGERTLLLLSAIFTALAALTRYPGVTLIGVGVLLLLVRRTPPLALRLKHTVVFGAVASIPLAGVLTRNWVVAGTLTGRRSGTTGQSLSAGLSQTVEVFRSWIIPPNTPDGVAYLLGLAVAAVILAGAAVILRGRRLGPETAPPFFGLEPTLPFGAFTVGYIAFMVAVMPLTVGYGIDSRFLLPLYVPLLLAAAFLLDRFLSIEATGWMVAIRYGLASLVLLATLAHIGVSARENLHLTAQAQVAGLTKGSYNAAHWHQSETLKYLRDHPIEGRIYSNRHPFVWFWDRTAAPGKYRSVSYMGLSIQARIVRQWVKDSSTDAHIVWFRSPHNRSHYGYDVMDLYALPGVKPVTELSDGVIFRATAAEPFDEAKHRARKRLLEQADEQIETIETR